MLVSVAFAIAALILFSAVALVSIPFILAAITLWRQKLDSSKISSLYVGKVSHTRLAPARHAFSYPLFIFAVDLYEMENDNLFSNHLWPLSLAMSLRSSDHLKNGEGLDGQTNLSVLSERIFRLVAERTHKKFQPTRETHRVVLVTHLSYYGYCFNPVSFYYLLDRQSSTTVAVVAEVSNTPWNEMYCYVLHPDSRDVQSVTCPRDGINYVFDKNFHVSPFMEMNYIYDWILGDLKESLHIVTAMRRDTALYFSATMHVQRCGLHPFTLAGQLARYPFYCALIQIWIHYEAWRLFVKKVPFQPHPQGAETLASRVIGTIMKPFFAVQAGWMHAKKRA